MNVHITETKDAYSCHRVDNLDGSRGMPNNLTEQIPFHPLDSLSRFRGLRSIAGAGALTLASYGTVLADGGQNIEGAGAAVCGGLFVFVCTFMALYPIFASGRNDNDDKKN